MVVGKHQALDNHPFNYSGLKGQTKVGKQGLHYYSKRVTLVMSSSFQDFMEEVIELIFAQEQFYLGNLLLRPELVETEKLPEVSTECKYLCISPLVISYTDDLYKNKQFIPPNSDEFSDLLYESTMNRMESSGQFTSDEITSFSKFQLVPDKKYIDKMTVRGKKFARIYTITYQGISNEVRGYTFPFTLYAPQKVQDFVLRNGLGELTRYGFGMLDFATPTPITREVLLEAQDS